MEIARLDRGKLLVNSARESSDFLLARQGKKQKHRGDWLVNSVSRFCGLFFVRAEQQGKIAGQFDEWMFWFV